MPAKSKKQQRFFGMVHARQKGEDVGGPEVEKVAKSISKKDAEDFASTKHKGLPEKVDDDDDDEKEESFSDFLDRKLKRVDELNLWRKWKMMREAKQACTCPCAGCKTGDCSKCTCKDCGCAGCNC